MHPLIGLLLSCDVPPCVFIIFVCCLHSSRCNHTITESLDKAPWGEMIGFFRMTDCVLAQTLPPVGRVYPKNGILSGKKNADADGCGRGLDQKEPPNKKIKKATHFRASKKELKTCALILTFF